MIENDQMKKATPVSPDMSRIGKKKKYRSINPRTYAGNTRFGMSPMSRFAPVRKSMFHAGSSSDEKHRVTSSSTMAATPSVRNEHASDRWNSCRKVRNETLRGRAGRVKTAELDPIPAALVLAASRGGDAVMLSALILRRRGVDPLAGVVGTGARACGASGFRSDWRRAEYLRKQLTIQMYVCRTPNEYPRSVDRIGRRSEIRMAPIFCKSARPFSSPYSLIPRIHELDSCGEVLSCGLKFRQDSESTGAINSSPRGNTFPRTNELQRTGIDPQTIHSFNNFHARFPQRRIATVGAPMYSALI
eukprot:Opistho-2@58397